MEKGKQLTAVSPPAGTVEPRRLAINYLFLSGGEFAAKILTIASFTWLARVLGPIGYGYFEFNLAVMVFFSLPAELGTGLYGTREIARHPDRAALLLREILGLRVTLATGAVAALGIFILVLPKSIDVKVLLAFYGLSLLGNPFLLHWLFQAYDHMRWAAAASIVRQAVFAGLVLLTVRHAMALRYLGLIECAAVGSAALFGSWIAHRKMGFSSTLPDMHLSRLTGHLRESAPIGLDELAWAFQWNFCTVLLGFVASGPVLGWFGASFRTVMGLHTFVWLYFVNLLPSISRSAAMPREHLLELMDRSLRFVAWTGFFGAGLLTAIAPQLLTTLFGTGFRPAVRPFSILVWMLPVAMLSGHHRYILVAYNRQKQLLRCTTLSAISAVLLGIVLVPLYHSVGAACALVVANAINFALVYFSVKQLVAEVPVHRQVTAPLLALTVSLACYMLLAAWNAWAALACACGIYLAALAWSDGRRLLAFARTIARRPVVPAAQMDSV